MFITVLDVVGGYTDVEIVEVLVVVVITVMSNLSKIGNVLVVAQAQLNLSVTMKEE